jgi:hypothetical protein
MGGFVSEKQWLDILGIIKVQKESLNLAYLKNWASKSGLLNYLEKAFIEAGVNSYQR